MHNPTILYQKFHRQFVDQTLDLSISRKTPLEIQELNSITAVSVTRIESDIWQPTNEFEFALIMLKHGLDYQLQLPKSITYPIHVQFVESFRTYEAYLLEDLMQQCGGHKSVEQIIKNKHHQATGYTPNYHGYKGYIFSSNTSWRSRELKLPYDLRTPFAPISVLRNTIRILSNSLQC